MSDVVGRKLTRKNSAPGIARYLGLITIDEAAREFGVSVETLRKLKQRNLVSWTRIGRNLVFDKDILAQELLSYSERIGARSLQAVRAEAQSRILNDAIKRLQTLNDTKSLRINGQNYRSQIRAMRKNQPTGSDQARIPLKLGFRFARNWPR